MRRIALITENRFVHADAATAAGVDTAYFENIVEEDRRLGQALEQRGFDPHRASWESNSVEWETFECALIRTTWNYFERFAAFGAWLEKAEHLVRILNPPALLRWNWDKQYLRALATQGVRVIESRFIGPDESVDFETELARRPNGELIIKPAISGGALHTHRMTQQNRKQVERELSGPRTTQTFLIQDVQHSVLERGEMSLMFFDGRYSHAVRKIAKAGDFRVQDDHGGTVVDDEPRADELELARSVLAALPHSALYARIDIADDNSGEPALMEAELIEPELFLRRSSDAAHDFAAALSSQFA